KQSGGRFRIPQRAVSVFYLDLKVIADFSKAVGVQSRDNFSTEANGTQLFALKFTARSVIGFPYKPVVEVDIVGDEYRRFGYFVNFGNKRFKQRSIFHHFVGNTGKCSYFRWYKLLWVY